MSYFREFWLDRIGGPVGCYQRPPALTTTTLVRGPVMADADSTQKTLFETGEPLRRCKSCKQIKPLASFALSKGRRTHTCKPCGVERHKKWKTEDPERYRRCISRTNRKRQLKKYGLSVSDYQTLLALQGGVCAICREPETKKGVYGEVVRLSVDHDHSTGAIRGLLCDSCNILLGRAREDPAILRDAAAYLEEHARKVASDEVS